MTPIYTAENCSFAYSLCWSLSVFWISPNFSDTWLDELKLATEPDGVRILSHRFSDPHCSLFFMSTRPELPPSKIVWSVKGRLQYLIRQELPAAFRRNYDLQSIGSTSGEKVQAYVAAQVQQHSLPTPQLSDQFRDLQIVNPEVDLLRPRFTAHGRFVCNLHIVLVHANRQPELNREVWLDTREMLRKASKKKGHLLSRVGLVPDHLHFTLGIHPNEIPRDVALSYMNNIAFAREMKPVFQHGCYLASFGIYDVGAIQESDQYPSINE